MTAQREIGVDPILERGGAQLLQTGDVRLRERLVAQVGERRASPEAEGIAQNVRGALRVTGSKPASRRGDALHEHIGVQLTRLDPEEVRVPARLEEARRRVFGSALLPKRPSQARDVHLERLRRRRRRLGTPQPVDQDVLGDHLVRVQEQDGQERTWLLPAEIDVGAVARGYDRPEDAEPQTIAVAATRHATSAVRLTLRESRCKRLWPFFNRIATALPHPRRSGHSP